MKINRERRNEENNLQTGRHVLKGKNAKLNAILTILTVASIFTTTLLYANPQGGQVTAGSATISSSNPTTVQVNQTSDKGFNCISG